MASPKSNAVPSVSGLRARGELALVLVSATFGRCRSLAQFLGVSPPFVGELEKQGATVNTPCQPPLLWGESSRSGCASARASRAISGRAPAYSAARAGTDPAASATAEQSRPGRPPAYGSQTELARHTNLKVRSCRPPFGACCQSMRCAGAGCCCRTWLLLSSVGPPAGLVTLRQTFVRRCHRGWLSAGANRISRMESVADRTVDWLKFKNPEAPPSRCDRPGSRDGCGRPPRLVAPTQNPKTRGGMLLDFFSAPARPWAGGGPATRRVSRLWSRSLAGAVSGRLAAIHRRA